MSDWRAADCPLPTRWAASVDPAGAHREHPRPQLVRPHWQSLNGVYDCAVRPIVEGRPEHFDEKILVPFPIESALSGLARPIRGSERLWYRRLFSAPPAPAHHTWLLHFGAVDWRADTWLDGRFLGVHEGGFTPFSYDVGKLGSEHELVVAVWDPTDDGPQPRGKQALHAGRLLAPFFYTPASGIWQSVWLELVPETRVASLRVTSQGSTLRVALQLANGCGTERMLLAASTAGLPCAATEAAPGEADIVLAIPEARRWSPRDPFLYDLRVEIVRQGEVIDHVTSYFGLRDIAIRRDSRGVLRFFLNDEAIFPHGLLDQGYWPDGIYTAPSDEAMRFDLEETKRLGFNLVRKHVKIEPARWYWHCDRIGLLVFQDMPSGDRVTRGVPLGGIGAFEPTRWLGARGIRRTAESAAIFERELEAMIEALAHHPSIVMWVPFNEGWGQFDARRIAEKVRQLDATRLVDAASGWIDPGNGDVRDVHVYHPGPRMPSRLDRKRAEVLGEWGGLGLEVAGHRWPRKPFAYRKFATAQELQQRYAVQFERLRALIERGLAAAVWTQTTDVEGEINGLLTYDRAVLKLDAEWLRQRNHELDEAFSRWVNVVKAQ